MIDHIKLDLPRVAPGTSDYGSALAMFTPTDYNTGECEQWRRATHRHMTLEVHQTGYAKLSGSLHKFWHGEHNGGVFPLEAVQEAVADLAATFGFRAELAQLKSMEFGLNVPLSAPAEELLSRAVLYKAGPLDMKTYGGHGCYREATAQRYYFKLYDKQLHLLHMSFSCPSPLLRVELKARKMEFLRKSGIKTLADLTNSVPLAALGKLLTTAYANVLFAAPTRPATLTTPERQLLTLGANFNYWQELKKKYRASFGKNRQRYRRLVENHEPDLLAKEAAEGIEAGWKRLLTTVLPIPELTGLEDLSVVTLVPASNPSSIELLVTTPQRCCQTCGRDISGQSEKSKYCSQALYGAAGKRCRNAANNPRHNTRRSVRKLLQKPLLIDALPYIRVPEELREFVFAGLTR